MRLHAWAMDPQLGGDFDDGMDIISDWFTGRWGWDASPLQLAAEEEAPGWEAEWDEHWWWRWEDMMETEELVREERDEEHRRHDEMLEQTIVELGYDLGLDVSSHLV